MSVATLDGTERAVQAARISVRLLGRIEADMRGEAVRLPGRQTQALFALLCLDRRPRSREVLAADLWPEGSSAALASLRQALWLIRSGLQGAGADPSLILDVDLDTIAIRGTMLDVDVQHFTRFAHGHPPDPEGALALYRGDLVEAMGHDIFARDRERLADVYEDMLALAARARLAAGDVEGAREAAETLLGRDDLREEAHEVLIAVHGLTGSRSQVVRQYRHLVDLLRHELDVEPLPETAMVYRTALERSVARSRQRAQREGPEPTRPVLVSAS